MITDLVSVVLGNPLLLAVAIALALAGVLAVLPLRPCTGQHTGAAPGAVHALRIISTIQRRREHYERAERRRMRERMSRTRQPGVLRVDVVHVSARFRHAVHLGWRCGPHASALATTPPG